MATRCCWPTDSWSGRCRRRSARPTRSRAALAAARACATPGRNDMPSSTFSSAVRVDSRLNVWKTYPTWRARSRSRSASPRPVIGSPATSMVPSSAGSTPLTRCSRVVLPVPLSPDEPDDLARRDVEPRDVHDEPRPALGIRVPLLETSYAERRRRHGDLRTTTSDYGPGRASRRETGPRSVSPRTRRAGAGATAPRRAPHARRDGPVVVAAGARPVSAGRPTPPPRASSPPPPWTSAAPRGTRSGSGTARPGRLHGPRARRRRRRPRGRTRRPSGVVLVEGREAEHGAHRASGHRAADWR